MICTKALKIMNYDYVYRGTFYEQFIPPNNPDIYSSNIPVAAPVIHDFASSSSSYIWFASKYNELYTTAMLPNAFETLPPIVIKI